VLVDINVVSVMAAYSDLDLFCVCVCVCGSPCRKVLSNVGAAFIYLMCFNNPEIYIIECISWTIKYLVLLMHGATMKTVEYQVSYQKVRNF